MVESRRLAVKGSIRVLPILKAMSFVLLTLHFMCNVFSSFPFVTLMKLFFSFAFLYFQVSTAVFYTLSLPPHSLSAYKHRVFPRQLSPLSDTEGLCSFFPACLSWADEAASTCMPSRKEEFLYLLHFPSLNERWPDRKCL